MSLILAIETATSVCSVALARDGSLLSIREATSLNAHSSILTVLIDELFREVDLRYAELDAIAVSMGPGSYTGLRIGAATAKGLCYGLDKPLIAIPTLQAMADGMIRTRDEGKGSRNKIQGSRFKTQDSREKSKNPVPSTEYRVCPMIDARRMEVYCAVFEEQLKEVLSTDAKIIDENSFRELLVNHILLFAGDGAAKCKSLLASHPHASFLDDFQVSSQFMISLAEARFQANQFEDLAYFEPYYLKDFVAGKPKVKGLR